MTESVPGVYHFCLQQDHLGKFVRNMQVPGCHLQEILPQWVWICNEQPSRSDRRDPQDVRTVSSEKSSYSIVAVSTHSCSPADVLSRCSEPGLVLGKGSRSGQLIRAHFISHSPEHIHSGIRIVSSISSIFLLQNKSVIYCQHSPSEETKPYHSR